MAIYRGPGGAGDATNDATSQSILAAASAVAAATSEANAASSETFAADSATSAANSATASATSATESAASAASIIGDVAAAEAAQAAAASSASAAATSATNAANSSTNSFNSATVSASYASNASTYATNASNSATAAATSATTASTQASNASNSAVSAASSASNAAASATAAATSATNAASSATSAGNSASSASTSATSATASASTATTKAAESLTNATNAASSATSAATSATNAANSSTSAATSATNAANSATSAAASYDSFDDRYLGAKAADPSLDNDGNALLTGALYWNSVASEMRVWSGSAWLVSYLPATGYVIKSGDTMTGELTVPSLISSGNVGIGVTNPSHELHVKGTEIVARLEGTDSTVYQRFDNTTATTAPYIGSSGNNLVFGKWGSSETMRIDSAGNLGLGVTPSAWASNIKAMQMGNAGSIYGDNSTNPTVSVTNNGYYDGAWKYLTSNYATNYYQNLGTHVWRTTSSGTAGSAITWTQAMTIGALGEVGIGYSGAPHVNLYIGRAVPGNGTSGYGIYNAPTFDSTAPTVAYVNQTAPLIAASEAVSNLFHYSASGTGLGSGASLTSQYAFYANVLANTATTTYQYYGSATSATTGNVAYGMRLRVAAGTGTNYNLYIDGNANNYIEGFTSIGTTGSSGKLHVNNAVSGGTGVYSETTGSGYAFYGDAAAGYILGGTTTGLGVVNLVSTESGTGGINFNLVKDSASPANGDSIALLRFYGNDSTAVQTEYGRIATYATTVTNGSEQGAMDFRIPQAGTLSVVLALNSTSDIRAIGAYNNTTASAANLFVGSSGLLSRSTSSAQYKTDIESLEPMRSEAIYQMRPVWYRSLCETDNANWSWYGFIAEEMAAIEPRLVHWGYAEDQYDEVITGEGDQAVTDKVLKADAVMQPEGVQYDRITVFLVEEMQKMKAEIDALKAEVITLKGAQ